MRRTANLLAVGTFLAFLVTGIVEGAPQSDPSKASDDGVWEAADPPPRDRGARQLRLVPVRFKMFKLNHGIVRGVLARAPKEFSTEARRDAPVLSLPMPDGTFARFRVVESPIMEPGLAAKFPEIKTYCGHGIDDPGATLRCGTTLRGFHAQVLSPSGTVQIEPADDASQIHLSFYQRDLPASARRWECAASGVEGEAALPAVPPQPATTEAGIAPAAAPPPTVMLRIYRLAVAADGEYTTLNGGTAGAMAEIVSTINRANGVFEPELAIRLVLVANNDLIIYNDPATDPYPALDPCPLADQNQIVLDSVIGTANYDIGHVISGRTGSGCVNSSGGVVCQNGQKAKGASAWSLPPGYGMNNLTHEMGHQLGANHTWNGTGGGCVPSQYSAVSAYEPGSGSTIMSYAGAGCTGDNLQPFADEYYHSGSFDQINNYANGGGALCRVLQPTGDTPPSVSAGLNYTIPARTPFILTATGSDPDGDSVTYCWEQRDLGPRQPLTGPGSEDNGSSPLFRSFPPTTNASRTFPRLSDILNNRSTIGEQLPSRNRTLHFRVTARDHRFGVSASDMQVTVVSNAGPFRVLTPNSALVWSGTQTVLWDVAGTTNTPINATSVNILLSTNGGYDFPITLATNTPNDGSEVITLPDVYAPQARIKVAAVGNIFFDISRTHFTIVPNAPVILADGSSLLGEGCQPTNGVIDPGEIVTVQFVLENRGAGAASNLVVTLVPAGGVLAPSSPQTNGLLSGGGARITNSFSFTADPALGCGDSITAMLHGLDGTRDLGVFAFPLHLGRSTQNSITLANTNPIAIPLNQSVGFLYPSVIAVSNLAGAVSRITVTLSNVTHAFPVDFEVILVAPDGKAVLLLSDASFNAVNNVTLTLDDLAPASLIEVTPVVSGTYQPTDVEGIPDILPAPAPPGPYAKRLSAFNGTNPNGSWRLFVTDTLPQVDAGAFSGGWSLNITTSNTVCCSSIGLALSMTDSPDPVTVGSNLTYTFTVSNVSPVEATGVIVSNPLPVGVSYVSAVSSHGSCAHNSGRVTCSLGTLPAGASAAVNLVVTPGTVGTITNTPIATRDGAGPNPTGNTATILTTVVPPPVTIFITDASVTERNTGTGTALFNVTLSRPADENVTVAYFTSNNTAVAGLDYLAQSGLLTFSRGATSNPVAITVGGDTAVEPDETFVVQLFNPTNAILASRNYGIATILNNDGLAGELDHFDWAALASPQYAGVPFVVGLTAKDANNQTTDDFAGPVAVRALASASDTTLGTASTTWTFPMLATSHDARLQTVYLASEIGVAGRITALALDVAVLPGQTLSNWTLRLKHTALINQTGAGWEGAGWTLVHQTNLSVTATGWVTFPFGVPFDYDGSNHLLVDVSFNNASASTAGECRYTGLTAGRSLFGQANSTSGDPLAWSRTGSPTASPAVRVPNLRLTMLRRLAASPTLSGPFNHGAWSGNFAVSAAVTNGFLLADDGDGHASLSPPFTVLPALDTDGDGMPDAWELAHNLDPNNPADASGDADGDGLSNLDEFRAWTDPRDPQSVLRLVDARLDGADVRIRFQSASGRTCRLERTGTLGSANWSSVTTVLGTGAVTEVTDDGGAGQRQRFYRVRLD